MGIGFPPSFKPSYAIQPSPYGAGPQPGQPVTPATETRDANGITLRAGAGADQINVSNLGNGMYGVRINNQSFQYNKAQMAALTLDAGDGDNSITIDPNVDVPFRLRAGAGRDAIVNGANGMDIHAGGGDDFILNNSSGSQISGGDGNDALISRGVKNLLAGGEGNDEINSRGFANTMRGEGGNDILRTAGGHNTVHGGPGDDRVFSRGNDNYLRGGWGNDAVRSIGSFNTLDGGPDNDRVFGLGNYNTVLGGMNNGWDRVGVLGYGNIKDAFHGLEDLQKLGVSGEIPGADPSQPPGFDSRGLYQQIAQLLGGAGGMQTQSIGTGNWMFDLMSKLNTGVIR